VNPDSVRREWAERTGAYSPEYYAHLGPNWTSEALRETLVERVGRDASVLELGCSSGRHLAHLAEAGFSDLHGVEVNEEAFAVLAEEFPALHETGQFYHDTIEAALPTFADGAFDAVFSVETLQHLHPDANAALDHLVRVTGDLLVTVENEGPAGGENGTGAESGAGRDGVNYVDGEFPLYYRDWGAVFVERGMVEVEVEEQKRATRRAFVQSSSRL
jgi:SAM-dependent methyltransferase